MATLVEGDDAVAANHQRIPNDVPFDKVGAVPMGENHRWSFPCHHRS